MKSRILQLCSILVILGLLAAACAPAPAPAPAPAAPAKAEPTKAPEPAKAEPTKAPAAPPAKEDYTKAERKDTVIFDIDGGRVVTPDLWNPYTPGARRDHGYHQAMLEPLFMLNYQTGKIEPWLGESFTANDKLNEWTLKLRKGVTWSDGKPYTADDVVFSVGLAMKNVELTGSSTAGVRTWVKEVKKVDDHTVLFILTNPNPRFQLDHFSVKIWGEFTIVPKHIWEGQDPMTFKFYDKDKGWPVATGPYKLASISETEFTYIRDDNWWGAKAGFKPLPIPKKLVWTWAGPEETRAALMADKKLDSLMDITLGAFQAIKAKNPNVIAWYDKLPYATLDPCSRTFEFNTTLPPWNDPEMRWAINMLIDREKIVKIAYEGTTVASVSPFPAYPPLNRLTDLMKGDPNYDKLWKVDQAAAEAVFKAKGWAKKGNYYEKDGKQLAMTIETHEAFIEKQRITDQLVEMFQAAGINATHRKIAGATWGDNLAFGKFEVRMGWQNCGSINEPWATLNTLNASWLKPVGERASANGWRWDNKEFSALVDQIGTLPLGDPKIDELTKKALSIYYKELPTIPVTQAKKLIPFDTTYWTNWPSATNNYMASWTWWQTTHNIIHNIKPAK
ncbi:MAG: ABC transporter substrate-binding protein [Chloroflexi bacterium]|nr:ABC transporter substrate-binding protein [Chloroflexota bacterium]